MTRNHVATERVETDAYPAADRTFGFLFHDVSRLLRRRFEGATRHTGLASVHYWDTETRQTIKTL
jgi:hypothetical protein